ncbi:MAG: Ig-like domain-containing protein [Planctomycetaceae bacterium]
MWERLLLGMLLACTAACGGGGGGGAFVVTFRVDQVAPPDQASDIPRNADILLFFSRPVDAATLNEDSLQIVVESGDRIFGSRSVAPLNPGVVRFSPIQPYYPFAVHRIRVSTGVRDRDGAPLDGPYEFEFQTVEEDPVLLTQQQIVDLGDLLAFGRFFHRATVLNDAQILVAGGYAALGTALGRIEVLSTRTRQGFLLPTPLREARAAHVQVLLADGRVLLAGGESSDDPFQPLASCEIYDPALVATTPAAPLGQPRSFAHGVLLADGRVFLSGGQTTGPGGFRFLDDAEIYDPVADRWTPAPGRMASARSGHFTALLPGGDVILVGGTSAGTSGERYRLALGRFETPSPSAPAFHVFPAATLLPDGRAFVAGGFDTLGVSIFDPTFGFLGTVNQVGEERTFAAAAAFADGRVILTGGTDFKSSPALLRTSIEVFHPIGSTGRMFPLVGVRLPRPTSHHAATTAADGSIWLTGGLPTDAALPGLRQVVVIEPEE